MKRFATKIVLSRDPKRPLPEARSVTVRLLDTKNYDQKGDVPSAKTVSIMIKAHASRPTVVYYRH